MLNQSRVLDYIKDNLGFPFTQLEFSDEMIIEYFTTYSLREFSSYIPDVKQINLNVQSESYQVAGRQNEYYLNDPDGLEIISVVDVYFPSTDLYVHGHPVFGPFNHFEIREWALATEMAGQTKKFSSWDKTIQFKHPNILRISPIPSEISYCTVEYERIQPADLRGIPNEFQVLFSEFALADTMVRLGRIRKKFGDGQIRTPFGEIPLSSEIYEEGKEKKRELIEKLERLSLPNVTIDHG